MKRSARVLVGCLNAAAVSLVVVGLVHCSGGSRPLASEDPIIDASVPDTGPVTTSSVQLIGYDPAKGLVFGDEGFVDCGKQATDKVLTIRNTGHDTVKFTAKLTAGTDYYKLNSAEGGIAPNNEAALQIIPNPLPTESDVTEDLYAGTLEIQFSTGEPPTVIRLHQTARGAIVTSTLASTGEYNFGDVKVSTTASYQFSMTNAGNREVTANFALGGLPFAIDSASSASAVIAPGQTITKTLSVTPTGAAPYADTLNLSFNTAAVQCKKPPQSTNLKSKGATSVFVTPGTLSFGQVDCGTTGTYQVITIETAAAMSFTPTLEKNDTSVSPYTLANDADGAAIPTGNAIALAAGAKYKLRIVPKPIPSVASTKANDFVDSLHIETTAPGDSTHIVALNQTARGAEFRFGVPTISVSGGKTTTFTINNTGNSTGAYLLSLEPRDNPPAGSFRINNDQGNLQVNNPVTITLETNPPPGGQWKADILLLQGTDSNGKPAVICSDLPPPLLVTNSAN